MKTLDLEQKGERQHQIVRQSRPGYREKISNNKVLSEAGMIYCCRQIFLETKMKNY